MAKRKDSGRRTTDFSEEKQRLQEELELREQKRKELEEELQRNAQEKVELQKNLKEKNAQEKKELQRQLNKTRQEKRELKKEMVANQYQQNIQELSEDLKRLLAGDISSMQKREKKRSGEILSIFAKHNFYAGGFTPLELRTTLEDLGPTYVKIGQIMSSRVDLLPESYCQELQSLRQNVKPLDPAIARAVIEQETGKKIEEIFREFQDEPLGSASIGQAHYGVLLDGTRVVTKVQRPLIADMMRKDFVLLKKLAGLVSGVSGDDDNQLDLVSVLEELEAVTEEELDFRVEADHTRFFKENCIEDEEKITCPTIIDELSTERIMTMTFVDGYSVSHRDLLIQDGYDVNELGMVLIDNYIHQVLDVGTFHGDPHQGNIMVTQGKPCWIDFGMIGHISDSNINLIQDLIIALIEGDTETLVSSVMSMGAASPKTNRSKLIEDAEAFLDRYMNVTNLAELDTAVLLGDLMDVAAANYITLPSEYTMLVRSLATFEGVLEELCPDLNLFEKLSNKMMDRMKQNFDLQQSLLSAGKEALSLGKKTAKIPVFAADALKNLVKGRMKLNLELTGYQDIVDSLQETTRNIVLAVFSCVLFFGSSIMCLSDIEPKMLFGMPIISFIGFIFSIALGIYTIIKMTPKK
ncbi:MAG: hypothetical protein IKE58_09200 [Blautia sp.]|nr:hypothetical protein [Blautia sp.]